MRVFRCLSGTVVICLMLLQTKKWLKEVDVRGYTLIATPHCNSQRSAPKQWLAEWHMRCWPWASTGSLYGVGHPIRKLRMNKRKTAGRWRTSNQGISQDLAPDIHKFLHATASNWRQHHIEKKVLKWSANWTLKTPAWLLDVSLGGRFPSVERCHRLDTTGCHYSFQLVCGIAVCFNLYSFL